MPSMMLQPLVSGDQHVKTQGINGDNMGLTRGFLNGEKELIMRHDMKTGVPTLVTGELMIYDIMGV